MINIWDTRVHQNMTRSAPVFTGMIDHRHRCAATHDDQIKISCRHCSGTPNVGGSGTSTTGEGSAGSSPPPSTSAQHWPQPCLCDIVISKAEGWCSPESDDEYSEGVSERKNVMCPSRVFSVDATASTPFVILETIAAGPNLIPSLKAEGSAAESENSSLQAQGQSQ